MGEEIFRKKSLEKIKSPEALNDYIKVSNPGVWLILIAVVALIIGFFIWGAFGYIDSSFTTDANAIGGRLYFSVDENEIASVKVGSVVKAGGTEGKVISIGSKVFETNTYLVTAEIDVPDGGYNAEIVTERVRPISFVLN